MLVYLEFSQGYRGAAFNGQAFNAPAELNFAAPEKLNSYEVGSSPNSATGASSSTPRPFHYDYRNQQFLDAFSLPGGARYGFPHRQRAEIPGRRRRVRGARQGNPRPRDRLDARTDAQQVRRADAACR